MIKVKKNIAVFLFGIFILPITFQPVHIVWHHSHGHHDKHKLSHVDVSEQFHQSGIKTISQKDKHCPICEYQFSINDLSEVLIFSAIIPSIVCYFNEIATQQQYKQVFSIKSPRAPPVLIS